MVHDYDLSFPHFDTRFLVVAASRVAVLSVAGGTFGVNHFPNIEIGSWIKLREFLLNKSFDQQD